MCGAPERLPAFGAHFPSDMATIIDHKVQLLNRLNIRELYTT
jgi:hypothetical protein